MGMGLDCRAYKALSGVGMMDSLPVRLGSLIAALSRLHCYLLVKLK